MASNADMVIASDLVMRYVKAHDRLPIVPMLSELTVHQRGLIELIAAALHRTRLHERRHGPSIATSSRRSRRRRRNV